MCGILFAMFVELCSVSGLEPREKKLTESPDLRRGNLQKSKYFLVHRPYVLSIDNFLGNNQRKNLHLLIEMNPPLKFLKSFATCSPCVNVLPKLFIFDETLFEFRYSNFFPRNKVILSTWRCHLIKMIDQNGYEGLTINVVTIDRFSQAADTSGNSVIKFKPRNQVTQTRNTTGVLFLTLPEQKESLRQKFLSLFTKKARTSTFREISWSGLRIGLLFVSPKCITHYKLFTKLKL